MNDFPRMLYKSGGVEEIHGGKFTTLIVHNADELDAALASGWYMTTPEALDAPERQRRAQEAAALDEEARVRATAEAEAAAQAERDAEAKREQAERDRIEAEQRAAAEFEAQAAAAAAASAAPTDDAAPTRAELEQKATELGVEFSPRIGDAKLAERIEAALADKA